MTERPRRTVPAQRPSGRREAEARVLAEAIRRADLAVALVDLASLRIVAANAPAGALVGVPASDLPGRLVTGYVADEPTGGIPLLATGRLDGFEAPRRLHRSDGTTVAAYVWVHALGTDRPPRLAAAVLVDEDRPPLGPLDSADEWRIIGSVDETWHVDRISAEAQSVLGCPAERLTGAAVLPAVHPGDVPELLTGLAHVHATGRDAAVRLRLRRADGGWVWGRARLSAIDASPRFLFTVRPLVDVEAATDRVTELEMRLSRIAAEVRGASLARFSDRVPVVADLPELSTLTSREWEVLTLLAEGRRVPAIAAQLGLAQGTVRNHLSSIFRKLGASSQAQLLALLAGGRDGARGVTRRSPGTGPPAAAAASARSAQPPERRPRVPR